MPELSAEVVVEVIHRFAQRLDDDRHRLNDLNVFPVADNDTGSNMADSVGDIATRLDEVHTSSDIVDAIEDGALHGRGNSGLIIGQFLAGFASALGDDGQLDLAGALAAAARRARQSVAQPVEGTMLTVADVAATRSRVDALPELVEHTAAAVEATTGQLDVLRRNGVVDSGAAGLALFIESLVEIVGGETSEVSPTLIRCDVGLAARRSPRVDGRVVGHEIRFRVSASVVDAGELRALLSGLGSDVVVGAGADELAAHLHVADVDLAVRTISAALETRPGAQAISYDVEPLVEPDTAGSAS